MTTSKRSRTRSAKEQERVNEILLRLDEVYPDAECALDHRGPFQLLVCTILSAQCTDERVNKVVPGLFKRFPTPQKMAGADQEELQSLIHSTGFYRNKAKSLVGAAQRITETHKGRVPRTMEELLELPGVARKTANVVLGTAFGVSSGIVVDTHVKRLSNRLGLTTETAPEKIERDLMKKIPQERWIAFAHQLIQHGRRVCQARKPKCPRCTLADLCPFYQESSP